MSRLDLKPCPFCGGRAELKTYLDRKMVPSRSAAYCRCTDCGATTHSFSDDDWDGIFVFSAVEAWNRRADNEQ